MTAAFGAVALPEEAVDATAALRLADERMYAHKRHGGGRAQPVVDALLALMESHDPELRRHADAVAAHADAVAAALGLPAADRGQIRHAALLHDVGTLALPTAVTAKPGPLDDEERAFVEHHTRFGERVIATTPELREVATLVRASHERWDGDGYPDRLAGEAIPLGARIVFACHAYDAIVSDRPHAAARTPAAALALLRRCAGSSFDPRVVEALAANVVQPAAAPA